VWVTLFSRKFLWPCAPYIRLRLRVFFDFDYFDYGFLLLTAFLLQRRCIEAAAAAEGGGGGGGGGRGN